MLYCGSLQDRESQQSVQIESIARERDALRANLESLQGKSTDEIYQAQVTEVRICSRVFEVAGKMNEATRTTSSSVIITECPASYIFLLFGVFPFFLLPYFSPKCPTFSDFSIFQTFFSKFCTQKCRRFHEN